MKGLRKRVATDTAECCVYTAHARIGEECNVLHTARRLTFCQGGHKRVVDRVGRDGGI